MSNTFSCAVAGVSKVEYLPHSDLNEVIHDFPAGIQAHSINLKAGKSFTELPNMPYTTQVRGKVSAEDNLYTYKVPVVIPGINESNSVLSSELTRQRSILKITTVGGDTYIIGDEHTNGGFKKADHKLGATPGDDNAIFLEYECQMNHPLLKV